MKKNELVAALSDETGLTKREANFFIGQFAGIVERTIADDEQVTIRGFGAFYRGTRASRRGINPRTGEFIQLPETVRGAFRAGTHLTRKIRDAHLAGPDGLLR